jgi:ribonuclease HI
VGLRAPFRAPAFRTTGGGQTACPSRIGVVRQTPGILASPDKLTYEVWSDGACANKTTRAGGYAAVLVARRPDGTAARQWEVVGGGLDTTNNRMELKAVVAGLRGLPAPARVCIFIDSTYVKKNFESSLERWQLNGWRTADGKPVKNRELWEELSAEVARRKVKWVQVPGHTGVPLNERADQLACAQRDVYAGAEPRAHAE